MEVPEVVVDHPGNMPVDLMIGLSRLFAQAWPDARIRGNRPGQTGIRVMLAGSQCTDSEEARQLVEAVGELESGAKNSVTVPVHAQGQRWEVTVVPG